MYNEILTIMKRLALFALAVILYGCGCLAQIPNQFVFVDSNCVATLPDYSDLVVATDNCELAGITQIPAPSVQIENTTMVEMLASDVSGNTSSVFFNVILMDTIPPSMILNPDWQGYTNEEIKAMYGSFYTWVQKTGVEYNEQYAGQPYYVAEWDTIMVTDSFKVFQNTIPIPDFIQQDWWEASGNNLVMFLN